MPGKYETILRSCYTGRKLTVEYNNCTFSGLVLEETKNTFVIEVHSLTEDKKQVKVIPKHGSLIKIDDVNNPRKKIAIDGKLLVNSPDKRIKLKIKRKW